MKGLIRSSLIAALFFIGIIGAPPATPTAQAALIGGGTTGDFVDIDSCGTVFKVPLILFEMPIGTCSIWIPDSGGVIVHSRLLDPFEAGDRVYIEGRAILAFTDVYPRCPGFPLIEAALSDCDGG